MHSGLDWQGAAERSAPKARQGDNAAMQPRRLCFLFGEACGHVRGSFGRVPASWVKHGKCGSVRTTHQVIQDDARSARKAAAQAARREASAAPVVAKGRADARKPQGSAHECALLFAALGPPPLPLTPALPPFAVLASTRLNARGAGRGTRPLAALLQLPQGLLTTHPLLFIACMRDNELKSGH